MRLVDLDAKESYLLDGRYAIGILNNAPTTERPQGEWIKVVNKISERETETHWECSECHNPDYRLGEAEFCSFCGAKMKVKKNETDN